MVKIKLLSQEEAKVIFFYYKIYDQTIGFILIK